MEREDGSFGYVYYCNKHQSGNQDKIQTMQDIIKTSKTYQRDNIEMLEKINKNMAEDWLSADFFDFNNDEPIKSLDNGEKKPNQDLLYNDYPIKKKKAGNESKENQIQTKYPNLTPQKRAKKAKKQFSPTSSLLKEKKKKNHHNTNLLKEKHQNSILNSRNEKREREKIDFNREKNQIKNLKTEEKKKFSEMVVVYPNFLDETRETYIFLALFYEFFRIFTIF